MSELDIVSSPKRTRKPRHTFCDQTGAPLSLKKVDKLYRDVLQHHHGSVSHEKGTATIFDPLDPLRREDGTTQLVAASNSPICQKCKLDQRGARYPYFSPVGPEDPLITIVLESVSPKEDARGRLASDGVSAFLTKIIDDLSKETGVASNQIRWSPITRCASREGDRPNFKTHGGHCKHFLVQELMACPPKIIIPVGSVVLGLMSHKSNAQDWGGKILTWRGWPDDWIMNPKFMLPREDPTDPDKTVVGHPLFGSLPQVRVPMVPIQHPRIIYGTQNPQVILRWKNHLKRALKLAVEGVPALTYDRPWYKISCDPDEIKHELSYLIENPDTRTAYDTETNGLKPWKEGSKIVFMMFRWVDKQGEKKSIGFPWDYDAYNECPGSPIKSFIPELTPFVLKALYSSEIVGHNGAFDAMFTIANVEGCDLNLLCPRFKWDTWHMVYTMRQQRGTIGLEAVTYDWCPDLAGYEEDMTLLIELHSELMHPESGQHAHYANCPRDKWDTHLKPYVMGDVESTYVVREQVWEKLLSLKRYKIPLAHPIERGRFRYFEAQSRAEVYRKIVSPASRVLMKMMSRGMKVDTNELAHQEDMFPKLLREIRDKLKQIDPVVISWCKQQHDVSGGNWELDLESPEQLRELLFSVLELPIERLTDGGIKRYGTNLDGTLPQSELMKYAKIDKYTLNRLSAIHPRLRPLQEYRRAFKAYSSYIRPIRNSFVEGFDKKKREKEPHLARDGFIHAQFLLTGTRSGRLASRDPNLQQLPRDSIVKRIYVSRFGDQGGLYQGDLSQIELRLIAAACGDPAMVDAYQRGIDLHSLSMSKIFNLPYEHCIKDHVMWLQNHGKDSEASDMELKRKISKTINFLTGYGGGAFGLQGTLANDSIYFPIERCESFLEAFFDSYPTLRRYLSAYKRFIAESGVAVSISGRVRVFEDVWSDNNEYVNKALRAGCNHLIQATASDMMLVCLCVIEELMRQENLESMLVSTVHDSLVIDFYRPEIHRVHEIVTEVFGNIPEVMRLWYGPETDLSWMIVPFGGDCEVGLNYKDTKKITNDDRNDWDAIFAELKK